MPDTTGTNAIPEAARAVHRVHDWADRLPGQIAVIDSRGQTSWSGLRSAVSSATSTIRRHGVGPGDRLLIVSENNFATLVYFFAAQELGAVPALANARLPGVEIERLRAVSDARLTVYAAEGSDAVFAHALQEGAKVLDNPACGRVFLGMLRTEASVDQADSAQPIGNLIFTSGTTGTPKAVMHSHRSVLNLGAILAEVKGISPGDVFNVASPLSHMVGFGGMMSALSGGATIRLMPRLDLPDLVAAIAEGRMTQTTMVPTAYSRLLDHVARHRIDFSGHRLNNIVSGGAPLDPNLKERVEKLFGIPLLNGYGMSEIAPITRTRAGEYAQPGSIGFPEPGVELRVVDAEGRDVEPGAVGEIWLRSNAMMSGYFRDPEATAAIMRPDGWIASGDLARRTPEGEVFIVGRAKELIIRSGFNVYPVEVEAAVNAHPAVAQCGVIGRTEADGNEEIVACVQLRAGANATPADIIAHVGRLLAPYKKPQRVILMEHLPLGATGKILKRALVEMIEGD